MTGHSVSMKVTKEMRERAMRDGSILKENNGRKTLIMNPKNDFVGTLGELAFLRYLIKIGLVEGRDFKYDNIVSGKYGDTYDFKLLPSGKIIDVKTQVSVIPPNDKMHNTNLWERFAEKPTDYYVFAWMLRNESEITLGGYVPKDEFLASAKFHTKGEILTPTFTVRENFYEGYYRNLKPINELPEIRASLGKRTNITQATL